MNLTIVRPNIRKPIHPLDACQKLRPIEEFERDMLTLPIPLPRRIDPWGLAALFLCVASALICGGLILLITGWVF